MKKLLALCLVLCPSLVFADMLGADYHFGEMLVPTWGVNYDLIRDNHYADFGIAAANDLFRPTIAIGVQEQTLNYGLAGAIVDLRDRASGYQVGPELGFRLAINDKFFVKENNQYMYDFKGHWAFGGVLSAGVMF